MDRVLQPIDRIFLDRPVVDKSFKDCLGSSLCSEPKRRFLIFIERCFDGPIATSCEKQFNTLGALFENGDGEKCIPRVAIEPGFWIQTSIESCAKSFNVVFGEDFS